MRRGKLGHLDGRGGERGRGGRAVGGGMVGERTCNRCGQSGHVHKFCPTIGNADYDPSEFTKMSNLPKSIKQTVNSIVGVDITNKVSIKNADGTFSIVSVSQRNLERLTQIGLVNLFNFYVCAPAYCTTSELISCHVVLC